MAQTDSQKLLDAIERVRTEALKSKEASTQFLIDAGIIEGKKRPEKERRIKRRIK
jgi:hypothetical protein